MNEQVMPKVAGKGFRCSCGCNVFTKYEIGRYRCNSCMACYESEEAAPRSEELPITDVQQLKHVIDQVRLLCKVAIDENKTIVPSQLLSMVNNTH